MSVYTENSMGQAIERIYDAAIDFKVWPAAVEAIAEAMQGEAMFLDLRRRAA